MPEDRRLAAIMFTDIVGYTTLMGKDEDKAFDMLARNRTIHQSFIDKFQGIQIKEVGDGMLACFPLATEAVRCAIEIQKACIFQLKARYHRPEPKFYPLNLASILLKEWASLHHSFLIILPTRQESSKYALSEIYHQECSLCSY